MANILVDLSTLGKNNSLAVQGIKMFLTKNKDSHLFLIADSDNLLTLKGNKLITIIDIKEQINSKTNDNIGLNIATNIINNTANKIDGFISYNDKDEMHKFIRNNFKKINDSPLFISTFANYQTHKLTCIGDLGFNYNPTTKDYLNYINEIKIFLAKTTNKKECNFKILKFKSDNNEEFRKSLENIDGYKGEINGFDLFKCDTDIVLGNPYQFEGLISGIDCGISIYDEFIKDYVKNNVGVRLFSYPMFKSAFISFHNEIDQKLTSGGTVLLGYDKTLILLNKDVLKLSIKVSLDLIEKLYK